MTTSIMQQPQLPKRETLDTITQREAQKILDRLHGAEKKFIRKNREGLVSISRTCEESYVKYRLHNISMGVVGYELYEHYRARQIAKAKSIIGCTASGPCCYRIFY